MNTVDNVAGRRMEALIERREKARQTRDLAEALRVDDELEDLALAADDRITCHSCQSWSDHAHHPLTGRRISVEDYSRYQQAAAGGGCTAGGSLTDPRVVGGRYRSAYSDTEYEVLAISFNERGFLKSITVTDKDGTRVHGTYWDRRDEILYDPRTERTQP